MAFALQVTPKPEHSSLMEALMAYINHGVPMVGIPLFGDQTDHLAHMKTRGAAVVIDNIKTTQPQDLVDGLNAVIIDPS